MKVCLLCQISNGTETYQPGEIIELSQDTAMSLAGDGLVKIMEEPLPEPLPEPEPEPSTDLDDPPKEASKTAGKAAKRGGKPVDDSPDLEPPADDLDPDSLTED